MHILEKEHISPVTKPTMLWKSFDGTQGLLLGFDRCIIFFLKALTARRTQKGQEASVRSLKFLLLAEEPSSIGVLALY